jgi:hypothetical protein
MSDKKAPAMAVMINFLGGRLHDHEACRRSHPPDEFPGTITVQAAGHPRRNFIDAERSGQSPRGKVMFRRAEARYGPVITSL